MKNRKIKLIDKKFQRNTALFFVGVLFLIISIIIAVIGTTVAINNSRLTDIVKMNESIIATQYDTFGSLMVFAHNKSWKNLELSIDSITKDIEKNKARIYKNAKTVNDISRHNTISLIGIVVFVILQAIILYILVIRKTHQISGPVYLMMRYMDEIIEGKNPHMRSLREDDELKELYDKFKQTIIALRDRSNGR